MSLLDKMIEKIGLGYEEYDDEEENAEIQESSSNEIPAGFMKHLQPKSVDDEPKSDTETDAKGLSQVTMILPKNEVKKIREKKSFFGGKKDQDASAFNALAKAMNVIIVTPETFDDSQKIADFVRDEQAVIINFERTDEIMRARIKDFVCGVVYALGGTVQRISETSLLCAPRSVDVKTKQGSADEE